MGGDATFCGSSSAVIGGDQGNVAGDHEPGYVPACAQGEIMAGLKLERREWN